MSLIAAERRVTAVMNAAAYNFMAQEALQPKVRDEKDTIQFWEQKAMTHSRHTLRENAG